ncbi:MAG: VOC family protein [Chloroflexota bacterium]|nr:MAG: VOC family protein [Chloroflexota bacterium]
MSEHPVVHIEITSKDPKKASDFYKSVFGWKMEHDERFDYYQFVPQSGPSGAFPQMQSDLFKSGDIIPYIGTDDIDADLKKVESEGGKVLVPKTEIPQTGWYAIFSDPNGARVGLYTRMES